METPAVAFTRKINPFGMPEFIAHEIEIAVLPGRQGDKAHHLVQGNGAINDEIVVVLTHVPVGLLIRQPEK